MEYIYNVRIETSRTLSERELRDIEKCLEIGCSIGLGEVEESETVSYSVERVI